LQSLRHNLQSLTDENLKIFNQVQALTTKNNDSNIKISQTSDSIKKLSDQVQITFADSLGALKQQSGEMKSLMVDNLKSLDKRVTSISENESRFVSGVQEYLKELSTARNLQKTALDHFQKAQEGIEKRSVTTEETLRKLVSHLENEQNEWKSTKSREKAELQDMKQQIELEVKEYEAERNGRKSNIKGEEEQWKRERASLEDDVRKLLEKKREVDCEIVEKKIGLERVRSDLIANQQEVVSFQNLRKTLTDQEMEIRKMHENAVKERMEAQREMNDVLAARLDLNKLKEHVRVDCLVSFIRKVNIFRLQRIRNNW
jgi:chromosome segregation ATPase